MLVLTEGNLLRTFSQLEHRPGDSTRDPKPNRGGNRKSEQSQGQIGPFEAKIGSELLVQGSLQNGKGGLFLGRNRNGISQKLLASESQANDFACRLGLLRRGDRLQAGLLSPVQGGRKDLA